MSWLALSVPAATACPGVRSAGRAPPFDERKPERWAMICVLGVRELACDVRSAERAVLFDEREPEGWALSRVLGVCEQACAGPRLSALEPDVE